MVDTAVADVYLIKAEESLAGAESEYVNDRYNNSANRCYYACFQAAIAALIRAGIATTASQWSHEFVHARFVGELINRRKLYAADLRQTLARTQELRHKGDYRGAQVTRREASHALDWATALVGAVQGGGESQ